MNIIIISRFDQDRHALFVLSAKSSSVSAYQMQDQATVAYRELWYQSMARTQL